jgi:hypothetical protein
VGEQKGIGCFPILLLAIAFDYSIGSTHLAKREAILWEQRCPRCRYVFQVANGNKENWRGSDGGAQRL